MTIRCLMKVDQLITAAAILKPYPPYNYPFQMSSIIIDIHFWSTLDDEMLLRLKCPTITFLNCSTPTPKFVNSLLLVGYFQLFDNYLISRNGKQRREP